MSLKQLKLFQAAGTKHSSLSNKPQGKNKNKNKNKNKQQHEQLLGFSAAPSSSRSLRSVSIHLFGQELGLHSKRNSKSHGTRNTRTLFVEAQDCLDERWPSKRLEPQTEGISPFFFLFFSPFAALLI
jgi:hypothetical protein